MTEAAAVKARDPSVGGSGKQWGQETIDRGGGGGKREKGAPELKGHGRAGDICQVVTQRLTAVAEKQATISGLKGGRFKILHCRCGLGECWRTSIEACTTTQQG